MTLNISDDIIRQSGLKEEELILALATQLYAEERLSLGQARNMCGLSHIAFQKELAKRKISIHYDVEDLEADLKTIKQFVNRDHN
ncbi:MAG: UPF0175 family protein [Bacteroidota bacterium]